MRNPLFLCLVATPLLFLFLGCGGESAESRMRKMAQAKADSLKAKEDRVASTSSAPAGTNEAPPPKMTGPAPPPMAKNATASLHEHGNPPATTAPAAAWSANATVEQRRARTIENLAKLGKALNEYSDRYAGYPVTKTVNLPDYPPMSWRVAILPLLGYEKLFQQYRPAEPWDSSANKQVLAQIPPEFQSPERGDTKTNYLVPLSFDAAFGGGRRMNRATFEDGLDYTLILVEADDSQAVEWTRPEDLVVQVSAGESLRSKLGSLRGDGFFAALASGRVCRIKPDADDKTLFALFTVNADDSVLIKDAVQDATDAPAPPPAAALATNAAGESPKTDPAAGEKNNGRPASPVPSKTIPYHPDEETSSSVKPLATFIKKKFPVPSEAELSAARAALKDLYADDYQKAQTAQDRQRLAQKLTASSREVGEDRAAAYELLRIARDLSAQNGDLSEALKSVTELEQRFEIDAPKMRLEVLQQFQKSPAAQVQHQVLAEEARQLVILATQNDEYEVALEALAVGKGAARRGGDTAMLAAVAKTQAWLEAAKKFYDDVSKAESRLMANPSDPQANQIVGIYNCLVKGRWESGLPQLAKATDLQLRFLAKLDLSSSKSAQEIVDLANQYWDLAEQKPDLEERGLKLRAAYWYAQATSELPDGLDKVKARKRLAEIIEAYGKEETEKATARNDLATAARADE